MMTNKKIEHPGKLLLSEINRIGMNQKELSVRTGMSEKHISTVINGTKDISSAFARSIGTLHVMHDRLHVAGAQLMHIFVVEKQ